MAADDGVRSPGAGDLERWSGSGQWRSGSRRPLVFLMYLVNVIGKLAPSVSGVRFASAYHYYGSAIIDGIWWWGVAGVDRNDDRAGELSP